MTVRELIVALQALPQDLGVVVEGYESGVDDVSSIDRIEIVLNTADAEAWWVGRHTDLSSRPWVEGARVPAVRIGK